MTSAQVKILYTVYAKTGIIPVRDKTLLNEHDTLLINSLNNDSNEFWIGPPKIIEYQNFAGFCYRRISSTRASQALHPDLNLRSCLIEKSY